MLLFVFRIMFVMRARPLWSGVSDKLIMHILPVERKFQYVTLDGGSYMEIVLEHMHG